MPSSMKTLKTCFAIVLCLSVLSACTELELASHMAKTLPIPDHSKSNGTFKVGNAYKVKGRWYKPKETYSFTQTGVASWYGPNFHGKKTANGETFDMYELTAAHKTLQLPSLLRVTNLANGKTIVVRVNDRGPFSNGRILDLSKRSAQLLGFERQGTTRVKIQLLPEESRKIARAAKSGKSTRHTEVALNQRSTSPPPQRQAQARVASNSTPAPSASRPAVITREALASPRPIAPSPNSIYVQAGSFSNPNNAQNLARALRSFGAAHVQPASINGRSLYRVRFGPMQNIYKADILLARLNDSGRANAIVIVD